MTCFWKGILYLLDVQEINVILGTKYQKQISPKQFVTALKKKNIKVNNIKHNDHILKTHEVDDNLDRINMIDPKYLSDGYLCSGFEPIFFLISHLFRYNIKHEYCGTLITYTNSDAKGELIFGSNRFHFYPIKKDLYGK